MREADAFEIVGMRKMEESPVSARKKGAKMPVISLVILGLIVAGCLILPFVIGKDPSYMDLMNANQAPSRQFLFGTDTMGRDSLFIGCVSTLISTVIAILFGGLSGIAPQWADTLLMRFTEIFLSIPNLLLVILLQAILGKANVLSVSLVIGVTSWASIAKVVRTEVRQIRSSDYVTASRCMGGGFFHVLGRHLTPNFLPAIQFMVVMNVRSAIVAESTLSFMGMGLPLETVSWGSMLSLAEKALLTGSWWMIIVPGGFLVVTLMAMTEVGQFLQKELNQKESNL